MFKRLNSSIMNFYESSERNMLNFLKKRSTQPSAPSEDVKFDALKGGYFN